MTHAGMARLDCLAVGIEDIEDLIADLDRALAKVGEGTGDTPAC